MSKKSKDEYIQNKELLETYIKEGNYKFLVDNMLQKLAFQLRNIGLDAAFVGEEVKTGKAKINIAETEKRIFLTKAKSIMLSNKTCPLIKITSGKSDEQLRQIIKICKIKIDKSKILGRCVKCNNPTLVRIEFEEAMESLEWENTEGQETIKFFKCPRCFQIFWEGGMFDRAKKKFNALGEWSLDLPRSDKPIFEKKKKNKSKKKSNEPEPAEQPQEPERAQQPQEPQPIEEIQDTRDIQENILVKEPSISQSEQEQSVEVEDSRINLGAINLTSIIESVKADILAEVELGKEEFRIQLRKEIINELKRDYELVPKQSAEKEIFEEENRLLKDIQSNSNENRQ